MTLPTPEHLSEIFAPFDSAELELLASFVGNVREIKDSRFGERLEDLGDRPQVIIDHRNPGGGGHGRVRVLNATPEMRAAIFAAARRLRTEHEFGSLNRACGVLIGSIKRRGSANAEQLRLRIEVARRRLRQIEASPGAVEFRVREGEAVREYSTREQLTNLAEYGFHFHQGDRELRTDWNALPKPLIEPSVDEALRAATEAALAALPLAEAVLAEPALLSR